MLKVTGHRWRLIAAAMLALVLPEVVPVGSATTTLSAQGATKPGALTGEAARRSPPGQAVVAAITAARKGDRAAVRKLLLPDVVKDLDDNPEFVLMVLSTMADEAISEITIEMEGADLASGRVTKRQGSTTESTGITIKRVDGGWKISL